METPLRSGGRFERIGTDQKPQRSSERERRIDRSFRLRPESAILGSPACRTEEVIGPGGVSALTPAQCANIWAMMYGIIVAIALQPGGEEIREMVKQVDAARLQSTVEKLASFHTRNTLSPGLTEACEWIAGEYRKVPGMQVELMRYTAPQGRRIPQDTEVVQVVATLPGEGDRIIIVGGHIDSLNLSVDPVTGRAPGANDDASGAALALEIARVMGQKQWKHTLVFVAFSGEEQGLLGARALAGRMKEEGKEIIAMLNNDTVGSSENKLAQKDSTQVRVFSEESEDHESRELARFIEWACRVGEPGENVEPLIQDFGVKLVFRRDRFGRGGDHTPFNNEGYNAVRFVEVHEEYTRQHTPDDLPEHMDWQYLANVTRANLATMALLANAGPAPTNVRIDTRQSHDTTLTWTAEPGVSYVVYWRDTASPVWQGSMAVGEVSRYTVSGINKDDHVFAVGAAGGLPVAAR